MHVPRGTVAADPDALDAYVAAVAPADDVVRAALVGLVEEVEAWNAEAGRCGGRVDVDRVRGLVRVVDELLYLDVWIGHVAGALRRADGGAGVRAGPVTLPADRLVGLGPPRLAAAADALWDDLVVVERDEPGSARVVRLALDERRAAMDRREWDLLVGALGLAGDRGPVHLVVHGWGTTTAGATRAGLATADLYDQQGADGATVVVVDWDAGTGAGGADTIDDFASAVRATRLAGAALAPLLATVARRGSGATPLAVTAHSLGAEVVTSALGAVDDPRAHLGLDLLLLQPAMPVGRAKHLIDPRIRRLTVTANPDDVALGWYEVLGPAALGDEPEDSATLAALVDRRTAAGLVTEVVAHRSDAGRGHLGLRPDGDQGLVRSLTQEAVDRARGDPDAQARLRRWIARRWGPRADVVIDLPAVERYLGACQRSGVAPSTERVEAIVAEAFPSPPPVAVGTTQPP